MTMDANQAIREMFTLVSATLTPLVGTFLNFPNRPESKPDGSLPWARVALRHVEAEQRTLQAQGQIWENEGILIVQLFEPSGRGLATDTLSTPLMKALRAHITPGVCWFRRVTRDEKGISEHWHQTNVNAIFEYDSIENP